MGIRDAGATVGASVFERNIGLEAGAYMPSAKNLPSFSFIIPVLNAERHIARCLGSIRGQDYPKDLVEIIVVDGGCIDRTVEIARGFGARVYPNPGVLAEYGLQTGIRHATGDLVVIFAADNELSGRGWLRLAASAFVDEMECSAVWGPLRSGDDDPPINRYFELIQSDPMTFFMNKNIFRYLKDPATKESAGRFFFRVDPSRPLVWGANGLTLRRSLVAPVWARPGYLGDNDAFQQMVENGSDLVAYIPALVTYHHHVGKVGDWVGKWKRNFTKHFLAHIETRNTNWVFFEGFRRRLLLWVIYSSIPLISGAHAAYMCMRDRNPFWGYHPLLCFLQTLVYGTLMIATPRGRRTIMDIARGALGG